MQATLTKKKTPARSFKTLVTVSPDAYDLTSFLECLHVAASATKKNPGINCVMLAHPSNCALAEKSGLFSRVEAITGDLQKAIRKIPAQVVYVPRPSLRLELSLILSGKVRITGGSHLARVLRSVSIRSAGDLKKLQKSGLDLLGEATGFTFPASNAVSDRVYLNLFSEHNVSGSWPPGHAARLSRLLAGVGFKTVIPIPSAKFESRIHASQSNGNGLRNTNSFTAEIQYIRKSSPDTILHDCSTIADVAALMSNSALVVSPAGAQTVLATLLQKPVITLHDMQSFRISGSGKFQNDSRTPDAGVLPLFDKIAVSLDRHLMPQVEECIENCGACGHLSCVDTISPERVFENFKKIMLPY